MTSFTGNHCDHSEETRHAVALAVTEACTNVVRHAYPEAPGELTLTAWVDGDQLTLLVVDHGIGLDRATSDDAPGLGLYLMQEIASTTITTGRNGTQVRLNFPCNTAVPGVR